MDTPVAPTAYAQVCTKKKWCVHKKENGYTCGAYRIRSGVYQKKMVCTQKENKIIACRIRSGVSLRAVIEPEWSLNCALIEP
jgi:hypothetical protein